MAIIVMNDETELDFDADWSGVILSEASHCRKVCFDLTLLKKKDKVHASYKIPATERILAFCKSTIVIHPLTISGVVFTNQAVYCCPAIKLEDGREFNRISYMSLDSCIITQEGPKGGVYICTQNHAFRLYDSTIVVQNVTGYEIRQILFKVQRQLFQRDSTAKSRVDALAGTLLQKAKDEMGIEEMSDKTLGVLDCLMDFPEHADAAAMVKAEYIYREFKTEKYEQFAESLPMLVSWDVKTAIKAIPTSFVDNYIRLLADPDREFQYRSLSKIYSRVGNPERASKVEEIIEAYLCIRMVENDLIESRISELRRKYGAGVAEKLEWFRCDYFNHEMYKVYHAIKYGGEYPASYRRLRDGLGLTPLHYAIILKNETAIKQLLEEKDWNNASPHGSDALPFRMYEYVVAAAGNQLPNIQDILLKTHPESMELRDTIKSIKGELKIRRAVHWIQDSNLYAHRMDYANKKVHRANRDELKQISANIDAIKEGLSVTEENVENLIVMLNDCEENIVYVMENAIDEALSLLEELRDKKLPLANYLRRIYFEPDFFEQVLHAIKEKRNLRLYHYKGFYFVAPAFAEIDLPYCGEQSHDDNASKEICAEDKPLYGNSWFSKEAHQNTDVLKSEYRKLAKAYHPDVCKLPNSSDLFKAVSTEYSQLYNLIVYGKARP